MQTNSCKTAEDRENSTKAGEKKITSKEMTESQQNFQQKWNPEYSKCYNICKKQELSRKIIIKER